MSAPPPPGSSAAERSAWRSALPLCQPPDINMIRVVDCLTDEQIKIMLIWLGSSQPRRVEQALLFIASEGIR